MMDNDRKLDDLFEQYRDACPAVEPRSDFMPVLWQKIAARQTFWFSFQNFGVKLVTASAALCLLLLMLNFASATSYVPVFSYADALMADHSAEKTAYGEAVGIGSASDEPPDTPAH